MPSKPVSQAKIEKVKELLASGLSQETVAAATEVSTGSVSKIARGIKLTAESRPAEVPAAAVEPLSHQDIRKLLKKAPHSLEELADALDCGPSKVRATIEEMKAKGAMLLELHGKYDLAQGFHLPAGELVIPKLNTTGSITRTFGVLGDNHLCNKHSRLDVLNAAYDEYDRRGITDVFNTGNWVDGEARFNKTELIVAPGMDNQLNYMIDVYPQKKGITTHYIAGDDHEGWWQQREGIEVGRYLQMQAESAGRHDLKYLGYGEADVKLEHGTGSACMRVVHPGGGSSYAISYTDQKRVESYQGGEKPQIELAGHYHKALYGYPREVHTVQTGCTCDQTMFMRKKKLQAHVGFWIISLTQGDNGAVTRFGTEWFPFFDRKYYEHRFGPSRTLNYA